MKRLLILLALAGCPFVAVDQALAQGANQPERLPADLKIVPDIVFQQAGDTQLDLMLLLPLEKKFEKSPLVIYIHGGGFAAGDKTKVFRPDIVGVARELNRRGFTCASIEYRLANGGAATVNESAADCKDAVRFLAKNAARYGLDPERIGTFGGSAGGVLTLITALGEVSAAKLYHLREDIGETKDLAAAMPGKVRELPAQWDAWNTANLPPLWSGGKGGSDAAEPGTPAKKRKKDKAAK